MPALTSRRKTAFLALGCVLGLVLICIGGAVWLLPQLIKKQLPALLTQATGRPSSLEKVDLAFWPLSLRIQGFSLKTADHQPMVSVGELYLEIDGPESLRQRGLIVKLLTLDEPFVQLSQNQDGKLNIAELLSPFETGEPTDGEPFPVVIGHLELHDGKLVYNNARQAHRVVMLQPIELGIDDFSTHLPQPARAQLALSLDSGAKLAWTGKLNLKPLHSEGNLKLTEVDLKKNLAYAKLNGLSGMAAADLHYQADYGDKGLNLAIEQAKLGFKDLRLQQPELSINLAKLDHETALTVNYHNGEWQISATKAIANGQNLQLQEPLSANLTDLAINSPYQVRYSGKGLDMVVSNATLSAKSLQVLQEAKQPVVEIAHVKADAINLNLADRQLNIGAIVLDKADGQAVLNADGSLNIQKLLDAKGKPPDAGNGAADAEKKTWKIAAQTLALTDSAIHFTDQSLASPVTVNFKPLQMFIEKFPALAEKSLLGAPRLKNGQAGDFYEIAKDKLTDVINPEPQRLKELAIARAKTIAKYLIKFGKVSQEQIFILDPLVDQDKNDKEIPSVLSLKAD